MPMSDRRFARRVGIVLTLTVVVFAVVAVVVFAFQFFLVVFAGILLAVLLDGLAAQVERYAHLPRPVALVSVILGLLALGIGFWWIVGPAMAEQVRELQDVLPQGLQAVEDWLGQFPLGRALLEEAPDPIEVLLRGGVLGQVTGVFTTVFGAVFYMALILFVGLYGAARPKLYIDNAMHLVPQEHRDRAREVVSDTGRALRYWFFGQFIAMLAVGTLTFIGLSLLGVPLALALALTAGLLEFVPYLGPILASVPIVLVALIEGPELALYTLIFFIGVQQLESYVITPMAQQFAVSMPPALLLIGQVLFGLMGGLIGVILATPVLVAVIVLVQTLYVEDVVGDHVTPLGSHETKPKDKVQERLKGE